MNEMVTNNTSIIPSQSPSSPVKKVNDSSTAISVTGNQPAAVETKRQTPADQEVKQSEKQNLDKVVEQLNDFVQQVQRDLSFSVDEQSGRTVVTVMDTQTEEVIRQIPSKEALERLQNLEDIQGLLFKDQA